MPCLYLAEGGYSELVLSGTSPSEISNQGHLPGWIIIGKVRHLHRSVM